MIDKKRYFFLDVLRVLAFFLVFFYHFLVRTAENGLITQEAASKIYEHPNFHMATLGVSLFFIISGMGLTLSARYKWNMKEYYQKRMIRILIPFYITYVGVWSAMFIMKKGQIFEPGIPKRNIFFTIAGIDGYVQEMGIPTFSLGVGEWFLGCLIMIYLIFPLLYMCMRKYRKIFLIAATLFYLAGIWGDVFQIPVHMNFFVKLYEFILGMLLGVYIDRINKWSLAVTIPIAALFLFCPYSIPLQEGLKITVLSITVLLLVSQLENRLYKGNGWKQFLSQFGKYSFEMYLIHHWVIIVITQYLGDLFYGKASLFILFVVELLVTLVGAVLVKRIAQGVHFCYNKFLKI